jgi:hypothetical protein
MTSHQALAAYLAVGMPAAWLSIRMLMRHLEG